MLLLFLLASRLAPTFSLTSFQQHLRHHQYRKATENVAASCALALGLCVATTTPVHALDASDYDSMYKSSMGDNTPFSFSLPKTPEIKKKTETSPPPQQTFDIPKMDMPKVEVPKVDLPKMDMPKMPSFSAPSAPSFGAPSTPSLSAPSFTAPEISLPSFLGGEPAAPPTEAELQDREEIDAEARATAAEFRRADGAAKALEKQAKELRNAANEKKKIAKVARDAACEYRPGGKLLCIRNPFTAGF